MKNYFVFVIFFIGTLRCEDYLMMFNSSLRCEGLHKNFYSDDLLLRNQIVLYWNASAAYNFTASPKNHGASGQVVCPGVSVRPAGRYVRRRLADGAVYFWLLHVRASIECPLRRPPSSDNFRLRLIQWIAGSESETSRNDVDEAYERGDSAYLPGQKESENLTLSCSSPQRSVILQDRLRLLIVSWDIFPDRFPSQLENEIAELKIRVQITSRLHFDGPMSRSRRREICELYGFWCNGTITENESGLSGRFRRSDSGDEAMGTCIQPSMRCDGLPDCWLDNPQHTPDEVGCNFGHPSDNEDILSPFETFNESYPTASSSSSGRGQSWTAKLPWMVVAFVPAVLLCALVRICSQRRQLDFATVDSDLHALEAHYTSALGPSGHLRRPHSLPAFENAIAKKSLSRGRNFLAFALRRSRSTEDVLPYPSMSADNVPLKTLKIAETVENPLATRNCFQFISAEDVISENKVVQNQESCNFQLASVVKRNRSSTVNKIITSCWSGDLSVSSTSSSASNSPVNRRVMDMEEGDDDCDVCRQMRQSALMMKSDEGHADTKAQSNRSHSSGSAASTPSTTSTSGFGQQSMSLERPSKSLTTPTTLSVATPLVEFSQKNIVMTATETPIKVSDDPLLESLKERMGQYDNPIQTRTSNHDQVT